MIKITNVATMKQALAAAMVVVAGPAFAASVVLPDLGPIPAERPALVDLVQAPVVVPDRPVIRISTSEQAIPQERRDVRIVGARFLPDASQDIDLKNVEQQYASVNYAEWLVMTAVSRIFDGGQDVAETTDGSLQVAAAAVD